MSPPTLPFSGLRRQLTADERAAVAQTLVAVAPAADTVAACVYGSRVAGYAKDDSDYDVLLVLRKFAKRVRYRYLKGAAAVSALLVDQEAFEKDAETAALGEFVVGRLLNLYEPLVGDLILWEAEVRYKRRVMSELLGETASLYRPFLSHLQIPLDYFLFEKLRRRGAVYPPALYSYAKTYSKPQRDRNLGASRHGFAEAARRLEQEGLLRLEEGQGFVEARAVRPMRFARLSMMLRTTGRGVRQYAVHGRAGRVSWRIVGLEARSKLVRALGAAETPPELRHPRNLWRVSEGFLVVDTDDWLADVRRHLSLPADTAARHKPIGEGPNISRLYEFSDGARPVRVVIKRYRDPRSVKWALLNVWALPTARFEVSPLVRLGREYGALLEFRQLGIPTPTVAGVVLGERILVTHFVEGRDLAHVIGRVLGGAADGLAHVTAFGEIMGRIHNHGFALGDAKPGNVIVAREGLCVTDLEQVRTRGDRAWDVAEFLYFSTKLTLNASAAARLSHAFLEGYGRQAERDTLKAALDLRYLAPFQPVMALSVARTVRKALREAADSN